MPFKVWRMKPSLRLPSGSFLGAVFCVMFCARGVASFSTAAFSDAFVATGPTGNLSANNYGGGGALALAAGSLPLGEFQSVLQFHLSGAHSSFDSQFGTGLWTVQSVTLQLTASPHNNAIYNDITAGQFNISLMQNNSWAEGTGTAGIPTTDGISFNSLQSTYINNATDQALGTFSFGGGSSGANSYTLGLTSSLLAHLLAGDDLSLRLDAADSDVSYLFSSRANGSSANRPTLTVSAIPEPGTLALCVMGLATLLFPLRQPTSLVTALLVAKTSRPSPGAAAVLQPSRVRESIHSAKGGRR